MGRCLVLAALSAFVFTEHSRADGERLFISRPAQVFMLEDLNGDGDYFDFAEVRLYAHGLSSAVSAMAEMGGSLYLLDPSGPRVLRLQDLNGDGDALDFGEVTVYAELDTGPPTRDYHGLAADSAGRLFTADASAGVLFAIVDLNGDGDALDQSEVIPVADGLIAPRSIAVRPDGVLLIAQENSATPVRILNDRNGDGDYFGFAENLSYAENFTPGTRITARTSVLSFLLRPSTSELLKLQDLTGDHDVLDFAEVVPFATGLTSAAVLAPGLQESHFVGVNDAAGTVYRVHDLNGDGDALDFGEVLPVAVGITQPRGMLFVPTLAPACIKGDADDNGLVNTADIQPFVHALLDLASPDDLCPFDTNADGILDGRDVGPFVGLLLQ